MICICVSLAALGLVSLAGCEVQNPSHLKTEAETIRVPSLSELLFGPSVAVSFSLCDTRTVAYTQDTERLHISSLLFRSFSLQPTCGAGPCLGRTSLSGGGSPTSRCHTKIACLQSPKHLDSISCLSSPKHGQHPLAVAPSAVTTPVRRSCAQAPVPRFQVTCIWMARV